jgi:hypothetical protein
MRLAQGSPTLSAQTAERNGPPKTSRHPPDWIQNPLSRKKELQWHPITIFAEVKAKAPKSGASQSKKVLCPLQNRGVGMTAVLAIIGMIASTIGGTATSGPQFVSLWRDVKGL